MFKSTLFDHQRFLWHERSVPKEQNYQRCISSSLNPRTNKKKTTYLITVFANQIMCGKWNQKQALFYSNLLPAVDWELHIVGKSSVIS